MKYTQFFILLLTCYAIGYGQKESISRCVKDYRTFEPLENTVIELIATNPYSQKELSNITVTTKTNSKCYFKIDSLLRADFDLEIHHNFKDIGTRYKKLLVNTSTDDATDLELLLPEKCSYHTTANKTGICPDCNKEDTVVKIVYGEPNQDLLDKADKGEITLGGCELDLYCQANWYCTRDKIEF